MVKLNLLYRNSHQRCSLKKKFIKNFTKFKETRLCCRLFLNKDSGLRPATLSKKKLQQKCFPVSFVKFSKTLFLQNTSRWLLLFVIYLTVSFCKEDLLEPSFVRKIDKISQFCHLFIVQIHFIFYILNAFIL